MLLTRARAVSRLLDPRIVRSLRPPRPCCSRAMASAEWRPLRGVTPEELTLQHTLPTGQTFRWRKTGAHTYAGVVGRRVVQLRQRTPPPPADDDDKDNGATPDTTVTWRLASRPPPGVPATRELADAEAALLDYLNLSPGTPRLAELAKDWAAKDCRYREVGAALPGARMLRQPPLECLFSFVCSSNNHISRIHGMVERLCARYGSRLELEPWAERELGALAARGAVVPATPATLETGALWEQEEGEQEAGEEDEGAAADVVVQVELATPLKQVTGGRKRARTSSPAAGVAAAAAAAGDANPPTAAAPAFWAFPTLEQLADATEEALRADGFGYRARYITGSVALLREKSAESGDKTDNTNTNNDDAAWLLSLRSPKIPLERAVEQLTELPGVGPKVASCVALFALDKHSAVPVDTHVWDLAKKYYAREQLRGKAAPQAALHPIVQKAFVDAFGPYAGWAHNALFVGELPAFQARVRAARRRRVAGGKTEAEEEVSSSSDDGAEDDDDSDFELRTPAALSAKNSKKSKKKAASAESLARAERQRRRAEKGGGGGGGAAAGGSPPPPLPFFESLLS